jgi:translocation and assembly module TamA
MLATTSAFASAETPPPTAAPSADTSAGAPAARRHASDTLRYKVVVVAPSELKPLVENAVDLVRWQSYEDMTELLFDRLAREAIEQAREAAAADGYFSANAEIAVDRTTDPATVTLTIVPGTPTRIADVRVTVVGPAATDIPAGAEAIAEARREWLLPEGDVFRQSQWTAAKAKAVTTIAASRYAAAKLTSSEALIDPDAYKADLSVEIDSGPAFRFGPLEITGCRNTTATSCAISARSTKAIRTRRRSSSSSSAA